MATLNPNPNLIIASREPLAADGARIRLDHNPIAIHVLEIDHRAPELLARLIYQSTVMVDHQHEMASNVASNLWLG